MTMTKPVCFVDSNNTVFINGWLSENWRYEQTQLADGAYKLEINESNLSEHERQYSILKDVTAENFDRDYLDSLGGLPMALRDARTDKLPKVCTATFDIDFSQAHSITDNTKRVYAKIVNTRYPIPSYLKA